MKQITINNYQYFYNITTGILYQDKAGTNEVPMNSFTAQEMVQFYNAVRDIKWNDRDTFKYAAKKKEPEGDFGSTDEDLRLARGDINDIWSGM